MTSQPADLLAVLKNETKDLQWMSESDYPFQVFRWQNLPAAELTHEQLLQQSGHSTDTPVEAISLDEFFDVAIQTQEWHGPEETETVHRYQTLIETLKHHLTDLKVYRVGTVAIDIYIVGRIETGDFVGLSTKAIET